MPPTPLVLGNIHEMRVHLPERVDRRPPGTSALPVFAEASAAALGTGQVASSEDGRKWSGLGGWLDHAGAVVVCRRTSLTIMVPAKGPADVSLLPPATEPAAQLTWKVGGDTKSVVLHVMLDLAQRRVTLALPFADTPEGRNQFGDVVSALTTAAAECGAALTCQHRYATRVPPAPAPTPTRIDVGRDTRLEGRVRPHIGTGVQPHLVRPRAIAQPQPAQAAQFQANAIALNRTAIRKSRAVRTDVIFTPPASEATIEPGNLNQAPRLPLLRRRDDVQAFPDLPRVGQSGWGQVPGRNQAPPLHFRDSGAPDSFFYLPTAFKLGFGAEGDSARPPMRAEIYLDDEGQHRVRVTLVALPFITESDRDALRAYLRGSVLQDTIPFVRLAPAAGLDATFLADFSSADGTVGLPANIKFSSMEVAPDKWLRMQFDMEAGSYSVLCELLRKGLRGRVELRAQGIQQGVPVLLELHDVISDAVRVTVNELDLSVDNGIDLPATLSSLRSVMLDTGPVAGLIFDAEEQELLAASGQRLDGRGRWSGHIAPQRITGWDDVVFSLGPVRVDGGAPQDWLDRVNRDPSLSPQPLRVRVTLSVPAFAAQRVELVQLRVMREGELTARKEQRLMTGSPPVNLSIDLTLAELSSGTSTGLFLEYETLHKDGRLSLPQRQAIRPAERELVVIALVEGDDLAYTLDSETAGGRVREELDGARLAARVQELKPIAGARWQIYARLIEAPTPTPGPTPSPPAPQGTEIQLLCDLIEPALAAGAVKKVVVVLQPTAAGAPSSTIVLEPGQAASRGWQPSSGAVPPFAYAVTYILPDGTPRKVQGVGEGSSLLIDWPLP